MRWYHTPWLPLLIKEALDVFYPSANSSASLSAETHKVLQGLSAQLSSGNKTKVRNIIGLLLDLAPQDAP